MFVILWQLRPRPGGEVEFERAHGPSGPRFSASCEALDRELSPLAESETPVGVFEGVDSPGSPSR